MSGPATRARVALVTGATSGIGRATALRLGRDGYRIAAVGRRRHRLDDLGPAVLPLALDLAWEGAAARAVDAVVGRWHRLDVVVAAAGHGRGYGDVDTADHTHWASQFDVNLRAPVLLAVHAMPYLRAARGHLVLVGSVFATAPAPGYAAYAATKHGLAGFARSLQREAAAGAVRVSLVHPGSTNTEFSAVTVGVAEPRPLDLAEWPFRPLDPDDVAAAIAWVLAQPPHVTVEELTLRATADR